MKDPNQVPRCCRDRCAMCLSVRRFGRAERQNDSVTLTAQSVLVRLVEIDHHARDEWVGAVLSRADASNAVNVYGDIFRLSTAGRSGKIEQNPFWIGCRISGRNHRSRQGDFHSHTAALRRRAYLLHSRRPGALRDRIRTQQPCDSKMFLNCPHDLPSLAGAPTGA